MGPTPQARELPVKARVLVSTFGSAGDLFPLVPVVRRLLEDGHDVRCAVPRALGLYLRAEKIATYSLGTGTEMRVFADTRLVTARFDGWHSWRETVERYVAPSLGQDVASLRKLMEGWRPDVVVTTCFASAARVAAQLHGVPRLEVTIYPQQVSRLGRGSSRGFASSYRSLVAREAGADAAGMDPALLTELAWGVSERCVLLHDAALLAHSQTGSSLAPWSVGFPYFDTGTPARPADLEQVESWLGRGSGEPSLAVTAGSFLGVRQEQLWFDAARAVETLGVRALFVGPRRAGQELPVGAGSDTLVVGFVPLSQIAPRVSAVVHHGGIGTLFATLAAGRQAAVVPQAFDQAHNARLVEAAGVGIDASRTPLEKSLKRLLDDPTLTERAREVSQALIPAEVATDRVVDRILARAQEG